MTKAKVKKAVVKELKRKKQTAKANGDVDTVAKIEQGLEALTRRRCARDQELHGVPPCAKTFVPMLAGSSRVTEHYCSSECALLVIADREGWRPARVIAKMLESAVDPAEALRIRTERIERLRRVRPARSVPPQVDGAFAVGAAVAYTGGNGSRIGVLVGSRGKVVRVHPLHEQYGLYYSVKFEDAKVRVVAARFVEQVPA